MTTIGVVGLGAMGAGIAQLAIEAGFDTVGHEVDLERGDAARSRIGHFLTRKVEKGQLAPDDRDTAMGRLLHTTDLADLGRCDVVIEAVYEDLGVKHALFRSLEAVVRPSWPPTRLRSPSRRSPRCSSAPSGPSACISSTRPH